MGVKDSWNTSKANSHYRLSKWSMGFFDINSNGHIIVKTKNADLSLFGLIQDLKKTGISAPVLIRFPHILQEILTNIYSNFQSAIQSCNYEGGYIAAYPIKVNQQASVIKHFYNQTQWPIAFEVGSKAELLACIGILRKNNQTIICNGYKDESYIRWALLGCLLGHKIIIVLESIHELNHVLKQSTELKVEPILGMRIRLTSIVEGNWQNTGGLHSKFGLTSNEVLELVHELSCSDSLPQLKMLHFHMGSQIPSLGDFQLGVKEGMRYFTELTRLGVDFSMLNVGGGLAVDYEGSHSNSYFSKDYSIDEYASLIIKTVNIVCNNNDIKPPTIYTENGRAMTAHHAVLVTNVIDAEYQMKESVVNLELTNTMNKNVNSLSSIKDDICEIVESRTSNSSLPEKYDELIELIIRVQKEFLNENISLQEKAQAENLAYYAFDKLTILNQSLTNNQARELEEKMIDKYFCNFSLFQSTPDIWGLNQIFPVLPLHRLNEVPNRRVRIHDLTCDSDGQISSYIEKDSIKPYLSLHEFSREDDYYLGLFLVGAYQEILGDLHNLFGDTFAVNIEINSDGTYHICEEEPGDSTEDILSYVHINADEIRQTWQNRLDDVNVSEDSKTVLQQELESALQQDCYLN